MVILLAPNTRFNKIQSTNTKWSYLQNSVRIEKETETIDFHRLQSDVCNPCLTCLSPTIKSYDQDVPYLALLRCNEPNEPRA